MEARLDYLFREWHELGAEVLLQKSQALSLKRETEEVLAESTSFCRNSGRLMWIVLDWLITNISKIDAGQLVNYTKQYGDMSVLGVLCDLAKSRKPNNKFNQIIATCKPHGQKEIFFFRVAKSQLASKLTRENPLEIFSRWNYICNEIRYLH